MAVKSVTLTVNRSVTCKAIVVTTTHNTKALHAGVHIEIILLKGCDMATEVVNWFAILKIQSSSSEVKEKAAIANVRQYFNSKVDRVSHLWCV